MNINDREKVIKALKCCIGEPFCRNCPWEECEHQCDVVDNVPTGLLLSAISLLKEQEPRVMTFDEARETLHNGDFLIIEDGDEIITGMRSDDDFELSDGQYMDFGDLDGPEYEKTYGVEFRFWTSRPTDEQRKAVAWDERTEV